MFPILSNFESATAGLLASRQPIAPQVLAGLAPDPHLLARLQDWLRQQGLRQTAEGWVFPAARSGLRLVA